MSVFKAMPEQLVRHEDPGLHPKEETQDCTASKKKRRKGTEIFKQGYP